MNEKNRSFLLAKKEERMGEEKKLNIRIGQVKDVNNRQVFSNHVLCAQFLRDYADPVSYTHLSNCARHLQIIIRR